MNGIEVIAQILKSEGVESQCTPFQQFKMGRTGIIEQPA